MDDAAYGVRDRRGDWKPFRHVAYPAVFVWPAQPLALLRWLFGYPGYILPWNLLYAAIAVAVWLYLTPPVETMQTFAPGWIALVLARNAGLVVLFFGAFHLLALHPQGPGQRLQVQSEVAGCGQPDLPVPQPDS